MTTTTLLDSVDGLTKRWSVDVRDGQGKLLKRIRHRPRLHMLEEAIAKSSTAGGGKSLKSERSNADEHAIAMMQDYTRQINSLARNLDVPAGGRRYEDPATTLRAWYVAAQAKVLTDQWEDKHIRLFTGWAWEIDKKLNPPDETITIERPCPRCESAFWWDQSMGGVQMRWPLTSERYSSGQHGIDHARVVCRFCNTYWDGISQVRALAWEMEQADAARDEMQTEVAETG